jgi:DNA-binding transcriptional LysR family regulator
MKPDHKLTDLNLLKTLDILLQERSVTRTARRLAVGQPTVSEMLNRLRKSFDDPLFVRAGQAIAPTVRAEQLAGPLREIISSIDSLLQPQVFQPSGVSMSVNLAASDYALHTLVVPFLRRLRRLAPNIVVKVHPLKVPELARQFENGDIDIALVTSECAPRGARSATICEERYVCMVRADHPDAPRRAISIGRLCEVEQIQVSCSGHSSEDPIDGYLLGIGKSRKVRIAVSSFSVVPELLRTSDLLAMVPQRLVRDTAGLCVLSCPIEIPGFIKTLAWHERTDTDPGQRWVRAVFIETAARVSRVPGVPSI